MIPSQDRNLVSSALGWQDGIKGTNLSQTGTLTRQDLDGNATSGPADRALSGATLTTGTYYYAIPTSGCAALDVTLRMSAHTGTVPTITLFPTLDDRVSVKGSATSVSALSDGVQATTSVTTLRGERIWVLKIVVPAASSATFDQASFSAL